MWTTGHEGANVWERELQGEGAETAEDGGWMKSLLSAMAVTVVSE